MTDFSSPAIKSRFPPSFYLALGANLLFFGSLQWTYVTLPGYIQAIGGEAAAIGLAYGVATLSAVVVRLAFGGLIDRWGRKRALVLGALIFGLEPLLYIVVGSVGPFLAVRLLRGLGIAAFTTAYTALVADLAPSDRKGEALGLAGMTNNLGMLFAPALGAAVQARWGYPVHFAGAAGIALLSLALLLPVREPARHELDVVGGSGLRAVARLRPVWLISLASTGLAVPYGVALTFMAPFAAERGLSAAGAYFTAFALATIVCQASAGWLSDRVGRRAVVLPGLAASALAAAGLALVGSDLGLLAAGAGLGLAWGLVRAGLDSSLADAVPPARRGAAFGFLYTFFDGGIGAAAFGLGLLAQAQGYAAAFYVAAGWAVVALAGYLVGGRRMRNK